MEYRSSRYASEAGVILKGSDQSPFQENKFKKSMY